MTRIEKAVATSPAPASEEFASDDFSGKAWRSLEELASSPEFEDKLHREFPRHAAVWHEGLNRRSFLTAAGASLGLAGLTACSKQPSESIVPYVRQPEHIIPGKPLYFATAANHVGYATGVLAESHMGRPTKIEGHPEHPASLGGTDLLTQASVLDLYDPDRSQAVTHLGRIRTWDAFASELLTNTAALKAIGGRGLRILTGTVTSPTLVSLLTQLFEEMPEAKWHQFESAGNDSGRAGVRQAFGRDLTPRFDLKQADVVLALESDFLTSGPAAVRYAKDFSSRRQVHDPEQLGQAGMNRLYAVDSMPTATSTTADHRLALSPTGIGRFAAALAAKLGVGSASVSDLSETETAWVEEVAADLEAHAGKSLVIAGETADPEVHVLACAINDRLGNVGTTVTYSDPVEVWQDEATPIDQATSFAELIEAMNAGDVDTLIVLGANPVYGAPIDQDFVAAMQNVRLRIHQGLYADETAEHCQWHIPESHYLECWGDSRAFDGTLTLGQPLVEPLYASKSQLAMVAALLGKPFVADDELMRDVWKSQAPAGGDFDSFWRRSVHDGMVVDSAAPAVAATLDASAVQTASQALAGRSAQGLELAFRPDPSLFDGRYANNSWLQECPRPVTKLTWDNALMMSPRTARENGLGDLVKGNDQSKEAPLVQLTVGEYSLELPVWVVPGHADGALTLHLGYGRTRGGQVAAGSGFDASQVRTAAAPWQVSSGVAFQSTGGKYGLASTQDHHSMEGRHLVRMTDVDHYLEDPKHAGAWEHHGPTDLTLMKPEEFPYDGYSWGMTIDLSACTGCNACVVACQAENNIPAVGKDQVMLGREMHWIRIDRYYYGDDADHVEEFVHQPVNCMHCEQAPCEVVCPVAATVHSDEGLNDMIYNRCVGTRYCSNNCPYKVRRFNFFLYQDFDTPSLKLGRNPDVSVRSRGVMEKCTYCVQRINQARIAAKRDDRKIEDGEIVTACQGVCPSDAITFGDINNPDSKITQMKASPAGFTLLEELGNRPRTTYLARIRNYNTDLNKRLGRDPGSHGAGKHGDDAHG